MGVRRPQYPVRYALVAAGAPGRSILGKLRGETALGPVVGASYGVASRIVNTLEAGQPARDPNVLNQAAAILLHSPAERLAGLLPILLNEEVNWEGRPLIICDCDVEPASLKAVHSRGAAIGSIRTFGVPGFAAICGSDPAAVAAAQLLARRLELKIVLIPSGKENHFDAALTLARGAFTPQMDLAANLLREAGVRDGDAAALSAHLFQKTAAEYAHSGKLSWDWFVHGPAPEAIEQQIAAAGSSGPALRALILMGFDILEKHGETAALLRHKKLSASAGD